MKDEVKNFDSTYKYYWRVKSSLQKDTIEGAIHLGRERLNPKLSNPDFLVLRQRKALFARWLQKIPLKRMNVLDVGGRIQPYRPLIEDRIERYIAIDPQFEGLLDVVAVGESIPFRDEIFDLVICTQVLGYTHAPHLVIAEIHRVLKLGATFLLSAPSLFPQHHDACWRFLPKGYKHLLSNFSRIEIAPEGHSISGIFRTGCVGLTILFKAGLRCRIINLALIPMMNILGQKLDKLSYGNDQFTTNYSIMAIK